MSCDIPCIWPAVDRVGLHVTAVQLVCLSAQYVSHVIRIPRDREDHLYHVTCCRITLRRFAVMELSGAALDPLLRQLSHCTASLCYYF